MVICMYRKELFGDFIERVERTKGGIVLVEKLSKTPDIFHPFPELLFKDEDEKNAVLLFMMCGETSSCLHKLILLMLGSESSYRSLGGLFSSPGKIH